MCKVVLEEPFCDFVSWRLACPAAGKQGMCRGRKCLVLTSYKRGDADRQEGNIPSKQLKKQCDLQLKCLRGLLAPVDRGGWNLVW